MIKKYTYGTPVPSKSVFTPLEPAAGSPEYGEIQLDNGFIFSYTMKPDDIVYGLGEATHGINKRGYRSTSNCSDIPIHTEGGAHNFLILSGETTFGIYLDYPGTLTFDIGYSQMNLLTIHCTEKNLDFYVIDGENAYDIAKQFRKLIGRSYIPPKTAFGSNQNRQTCPPKRDCRDVRTGVNCSWWSDLLLNLKMIPSLNMCGFLYAGTDFGGFSGDCSRDLLLRWLALDVFTPLMRIHPVVSTKNLEDNSLENIEDFHHIIGVRRRLLPYLYSEYMKAALTDDMYIRPLSFDYPDDPVAARIEDQLMLGHEIMIAPVYTQNATGRHVYLPEEMILVKFLPDNSISYEILGIGNHFISVPLNVISLFIRSDKCIPVADTVENADVIDTDHLLIIGYPCSSYVLYENDNDNCTAEYDLERSCRVLP